MKMYFVYCDIILLIITGHLPSAQVYIASQIFANWLQTCKMSFPLQFSLYISIIERIKLAMVKRKTKPKQKFNKQNWQQEPDQAYDIPIKLKTTSDIGKSYLLTWKPVEKSTNVDE